jgi:hypothetical protein
MQVTFTYRDTAGDFYVDAEVSGNKVHIVSITDDWKQDIDIDDFSDDERRLMRGLALREYENIVNSDDDEQEADNDEERE